jgi:hypothetical protein
LGERRGDCAHEGQSKNVLEQASFHCEATIPAAILRQAQSEKGPGMIRL